MEKRRNCGPKEPPVTNKSLAQLADHFGSDKGSVHGDCHRFAQVYELIFGKSREQVLKVAELGLARGIHQAAHVTKKVATVSPSILMWHEYFPNATIYGFDIADFSAVQRSIPNFFFQQGDSGRVEDLRAFARLIANDVDIVIDDASHASFHQQLALKELFSCLKPGGHYIVEDLHFQPPEIEWNLPLVHKTSDWLEALRQGKGLLSAIWDEGSIRQLSAQIDTSVTLGNTQVPGSRFASSVAILRKK